MSKQRQAKGDEAYGNNDAEKEYPLKKGEDQFYVVRHFNTAGVHGDIADPGTFNYQFYSPEVFEEYTREDEKSGKTNQLYVGGQKYIVLNDPTKTATKED